MSKVVIKRISFFIFFTIVIFLLAIYNQNSSTLVIDEASSNCKGLRPQVFFSDVKNSFSEKKSVRSNREVNNFYHFIVPEKNRYIRLDPTQKKCIVSINSIYLEKNIWFKKSVYSIDSSLILPYNQIKDFKHHNNKLSFITTGNDSQLLMELDEKFQYSEYNLHIDLLLLSIFIVSILFFVKKLYIDFYNGNYMQAKVILYSFFLLLAFVKVNYYKEHVRFIYTPDIVAHFSYINDMESSPTLVPKFEDMYMITNHNAGNHLGHPPLYYLFMTLTYSNNMTSVQNASAMRLVNIMLFMLSMLMILYLSFNIKISIISHFVYLSVITSIPMHAYLGAAVTNDNFAFLGGMLFIFALKRFLEKDNTIVTYFYLSSSIFIAYFSKFTALLLILFATIYALIYLYKNRLMPKIDSYKLVMLLLSVIPILFYQIHIFTYYHAIVPTLNITHPVEYLHSVYYVDESHRVYKDFQEWLELYWDAVKSGWFNIHSHHSFHKGNVFGYIGLLLLHIFALFSLFLPCKDNKVYCITGKIVLYSLFTVALIQLLFGYNTHLHSGYVGGLQTRYLLPFMVGFAIMAAMFVERFKKYFWWNIVVILLSIQAIYSDFFYFLLYYK